MEGLDRPNQGFQFLGIPPKGEPVSSHPIRTTNLPRFQFLGIPPKGELECATRYCPAGHMFPISRDPPEGGTIVPRVGSACRSTFPISRDPPEGGTPTPLGRWLLGVYRFQFLGIPPKGELAARCADARERLGFPISRDPPEGGTGRQLLLRA